MKLFKKRKLLPYIIGYHEKGILVENVGTSQEKIFYIKSEATQEPSEHRKIKLKREVNKRCNISLVECLTSRIFQKLGIDAVSYHLGKVASTLFPNRWVNVSYSESFVSNNEHQIPLDSFYKFKCFKSKNKLASTPKELIEGQRVAAYKEITEKFPPRTYVDEDVDILKEFLEEHKNLFPGGFIVDYDLIKCVLIIQTIGDLICYNLDHHTDNIVFISKIQKGKKGDECSIRVGPAFDFDQTFFSEFDQIKINQYINNFGISCFLDVFKSNFLSLTNCDQKRLIDEYTLMHDYLVDLKKKKTHTKGEKMILEVVQSLKDIDVCECLKEVLVEEIDNTNKNMTLSELMHLYNQQMDKNFDNVCLDNICKFFDYSRSFLLENDMINKVDFTKNPRLHSTFSTLFNDSEDNDVIDVQSTDTSIKERAMGDD